jgi:hypothetical protein
MNHESFGFAAGGLLPTGHFLLEICGQCLRRHPGAVSDFVQDDRYSAGRAFRGHVQRQREHDFDFGHPATVAVRDDLRLGMGRAGDRLLDIRSGVRFYAVSKLLASALSGFLVTFTGILLYALILLTRLPFFTRITTGDAYVPLLEAGKPVQYLLVSSAHLSLSSVVFAVAALWISAYIPNRFTAIAAPAVLYFALYRLTRFWEIPPFLNVATLVEGTYHAGSPLASFLVKLGTVTVLCVLMGIGTDGQIPAASRICSYWPPSAGSLRTPTSGTVCAASVWIRTVKSP